MFKLLAIVASAIMFTGCASTPPVTAPKPNYCHTSEDITVQNGSTVDSKTRVQCTDSQIERLFAKRSGMAPNCGEFNYWMMIGGHNVQRKGISCQKPDGSWEIVHTDQY